MRKGSIKSDEEELLVLLGEGRVVDKGGGSEVKGRVGEPAPLTATGKRSLEAESRQEEDKGRPKYSGKSTA